MARDGVLVDSSTPDLIFDIRHSTFASLELEGRRERGTGIGEQQLGEREFSERERGDRWRRRGTW